MISSQIQFSKEQFPFMSVITWDDAIKKLFHDYSIVDGVRIVSTGGNTPQSYVSHTSYRPGSIGLAYDGVRKNYSVNNLHVYMSLLQNSHTFGMHNDDVDVMIVQAIGSMRYKFDEGEVLMNPGDAVFIPKGVNHCPVVLGPRVTLSFDFLG